MDPVLFILQRVLAGEGWGRDCRPVVGSIQVKKMEVGEEDRDARGRVR